MSSRRHFLASSATLAIGSQLIAQGKPKPVEIKKALKFSMIQGEGSVLEKVQRAKEAGFHGVEFNNTPLDEATLKEIEAAIAATGLEVPGLVAGGIGRKCGSLDEKVRAEGVAQYAEALRHSKRLGGTTVLMYPGAVDAKNPYDKVYATLQKSIRELIPVAEETGVKIACENVWNNIFISPLETRDFIDSFESDYVGWFFDVGNVVRYGWPEQWIRVLGKRIFKLDIKEFDRNIMMKEGTSKGFRVPLGEGSVDWPAVMNALDEIGYAGGWGSAEVPGGDLARLKEISARMDRCFER